MTCPSWPRRRLVSGALAFRQSREFRESVPAVVPLVRRSGLAVKIRLGRLSEQSGGELDACFVVVRHQLVVLPQLQQAGFRILRTEPLCTPTKKRQISLQPFEVDEVR